MDFDYFYGEQSESYAFYRTPKVFFTDERFRVLSSDAKILYGILLDRVSMSSKNKWLDEGRRVYVYMTLNSIDKSLYNPVPVYISGAGEWYTGDILKDVSFYKKLNYKKLKRVTFIFGDDALYILKGKKACKKIPVYAAINCLHGLNGEDEKTQREVADMLGISQSYISRLEKRIIDRLKDELKKLSY